jgi:hypothetical protein
VIGVQGKSKCLISNRRKILKMMALAPFAENDASFCAFCSLEVGA